MLAGDFVAAEGEGSPWQNPANRFDVNDDTMADISDALLLANELNDPRYIDADGKLPDTRPDDVLLFFDVNGDGFLKEDDVDELAEEIGFGQPKKYDFGDAPTSAQSGFASSYPTVDGASHRITSLFLGESVDDEVNGIPDASAGVDRTGGDDKDGIDDEDGIRLLATLIVSKTTPATSSINVVASGNGKLDGWIDFNRDGDWSDAGEQVFVSESITAGAENTLNFTIPSTASIGSTAARFRFSSSGGLTFTGEANDGEVEDYVWDLIDEQGFPIALVTPVGETTQIRFENNQIVVNNMASSTTDLFSSGLQSISRLDVFGSDSSQTLKLDYATLKTLPVDPVASDVVRLNGGEGINTLAMEGLEQTLDLSSLVGKVDNFSIFDLTDDVMAEVLVDPQSVRSLAPTAKTIRVVGSQISETERDEIRFTDRTEWMIGPASHDGGGKAFRNVVSGSGTERVTVEVDLPAPWQNVLTAEDVNNEGGITAIDALMIITELELRAYSEFGGRLATDSTPASPLALGGKSRFFDVDGNNLITAFDALLVINAIELQGPKAAVVGGGGGGAGELVAYDFATWPSRIDSQSAEGAIEWGAGIGPEPPKPIGFSLPEETDVPLSVRVDAVEKVASEVDETRVSLLPLSLGDE
ncbi:GEVED domain-containing protein [Novipirellula sp. SH528]|uniref:GEVED domain-containing protein n=1 Tax=Novipirellula sp. SH528 TaxID=3454466 RepID=UPI003FA0CD3E